MIFAIFASSSPLHPSAGGWAGEKGGEREQCGWESLTVGTELCSTVPKSRVMFVTRVGGMQIPLGITWWDVCASPTIHRSTQLFGQTQGYVQPSDGSDQCPVK